MLLAELSLIAKGQIRAPVGHNGVELLIAFGESYFDVFLNGD